jgi:hypothetical protein
VTASEFLSGQINQKYLASAAPTTVGMILGSESEQDQKKDIGNCNTYGGTSVNCIEPEPPRKGEKEKKRGDRKPPQPKKGETSTSPKHS